MNCCGSCGIQIPDGQNYCSMCVGDVGYGRDGYYEEWLREQDSRRQEEEEAEEAERTMKEEM